MLKTDFKTYLKERNLNFYDDKILKIKNTLDNGGEMLDWYDINKCISPDDISKIKNISKEILFMPKLNVRKESMK